jgi:hypothetical protein
VGAHTCTATAACAHTASGASVDSGTTSGVHRVSAHSRCIILQIFHATRLRMLFWTASHRVFTFHAHPGVEPPRSRTRRIHVAMAAPGTNTPAVLAPYVPAMRAHRATPTISPPKGIAAPNKIQALFRFSSFYLLRSPSPWAFLCLFLNKSGLRQVPDNTHRQFIVS